MTDRWLAWGVLWLLVTAWGCWLWEVDEFTFRLNEGNVAIHTLDRLDSFVDGMAGKRLTYAGLIA